MADSPVPDFTWRVRVYWEDTDGEGVVFYANYFRFLERARTEWLRQKGIVQSRMQQDIGAVLVVKNLQADFIQAARLDDELDVTVTMLGRGGASMTLGQDINRVADGAPVLKSTLKAACLDGEKWTPIRFPPQLKKALT
ncbi:MAG: YbgC/FadM family acyl-CoA thioesterase [Xanthomonadales bacterium]|nr:YbgC/FadM family acyl-CoA thioesterase [Xanthomonadales bacterium]